MIESVKKAFAKLFYLTLKLLLKLLAQIDRIYTFFRVFFLKDPTQILCDYERKGPESKKNNNFKEIMTSVAIIIPFKDNWPLTQACLEGLLFQEKKKINLHILLVDNNSEKKETKEKSRIFLEKNKNSGITLLPCPSPFNFSYINNFAVKSLDFKPDYLWFLNNDISFISKKTLKDYTEFALSHPNLGALSSTLLFGDKKTVQHSFLAPGIKIAGAHPLKGSFYDKTKKWYKKPRNVPAVTGASLFTSYKNFCKTGMFDEKLAFSCQDLDLCLRLKKQGLSNWTLTQTALIHHESMSRSHSFCEKEITYFYKKWGEKLFKYSPGLSTWHESPSFKLFPFSYPWKIAMRVQNKLFKGHLQSVPQAKKKGRS